MMARRFAIALILVFATGLSQPLAFAQDPAPPADRLPYDGLSDLPRLPSAAPAAVPDAPQAPLAPQATPWSWLVFQSLRNQQDWDIYTARGDGTEQANVTHHPASDVYPRLNRDATRIVFSSNRDGNYEIYTMNPDGSGLARLTNHPENDIYPGWSPDGGQIVFQSYRDGQAEIYVMNADGSNLRRLTKHSDYDGEAAWSPDGTRIAFTRRVSGMYRIWVMNSDGRDQHQLSDQHNSENPAWSPDSTQIAYDSDGDHDNWQELWVMDATGGNQHIVHDPPPGTDAWVRSWMPNGRGIAFTHISWVLYEGRWYWDTAYLKVYQDMWNTLQLTNTGLDWYPDLLSTDRQAPVSAIAPLPAQSPYKFTVQWSSSDAGGSGLSKVYVQAYPNLFGEWYQWQETTGGGSASFEGVGGRTYSFRARAEDIAGNVELLPAGAQASTTVEALPPVTAIQPLPTYTRGEGVDVKWSGSDPGGSGIARYDVQVRDGDAGAWTDWLPDTTAAGDTYIGTPGHTYYFRVRGTDRAQNVEAWPSAGAEPHTTFYRWAIGGTVRDSGGAAVPGAAITTSPAALAAATSGPNGDFIARGAAEATAYEVSVARTGYGALPATAYAAAEDARVELILPPVDNGVRNWGFESGSLGPDWETDGPVPAVVTTALRHTGKYAAHMGAAEVAFETPVNVSTAAGASNLLQMVVDDSNTVHMAWQDYSGSNPDILYSWRRADDPAFAPPMRIATPEESGEFDLAVDPTGTAHLVWAEWNGTDRYIVYASRAPGGAWSAPKRISTGKAAQDAQIVVDASNGAHAVWYSEGVIYYDWKEAGGSWHGPLALSGSTASPWSPRLAVDQVGQVHVMWGDGGVRYTCRSAAGVWSTPRVVAPGNGEDRLAVSPEGQVHIASTGYSGNGDIWHAQGSCRGAWSSPHRVSVGYTGDRYPALAVERTGTVHLVWWHTDWSRSDALYARSLDGITWSTPQSISPPPLREAQVLDTSLAVDGHDTVHAVWHGISIGDYQVQYARRTGDGAWSAPRAVSLSLESAQIGASVAVGDDGRVHIGWLQGSVQNARGVYYSRSLPGEQTGESTLRQAITVPPVAANPGLSFLYHLGNIFSPGSASFDVIVQAGTGSTTLYTTSDATDDWTHRWFDLTPWAGQNVTLIFRLRQAAGEVQPWVYLDEVSVGSSHPDTWVQLAGTTAAVPGAQFTGVLLYGNRSDVTASGARVTLQLPPELTLVNADPPPSATAPNPRWDVGNLTGHAAAAIHVTLQLAATAERGATIVTTAAIASDTPEMEQANNTTQSVTFIGHQARLPQVQR